MSKRKTPNMRHLEEERVETNAEKKSRQERAELDQLKRDRPSLQTHMYEKELRKIATKGVVALFNAVSEAQQPAEDETTKVAKDMDKSEFLNMLKTKTASKNSTNNSSSSSSSGDPDPEDVAPSYLRDDYMGGASMKHWDQEDDEEEDDGERNDDGPEESSGSESD